MRASLVSKGAVMYSCGVGRASVVGLVCILQSRFREPGRPMNFPGPSHSKRKCCSGPLWPRIAETLEELSYSHFSRALDFSVLDAHPAGPVCVACKAGKRAHR